MTVEISIDMLVQMIVREVLAELARRGIVPGGPPGGNQAVPAPGVVPVDMTGYRTPVLTEQRVRSLGPHVREISVPAGTVCTAGAREVLQQRKMKLTFTGNTH
ncbi:MAG TPA: hypothetical protein VMF59_10530 [Bacteroidota bacterium]|nr:hypothetical protein [Bacteroidota bacterium]